MEGGDWDRVRIWEVRRCWGFYGYHFGLPIHLHPFHPAQIFAQAHGGRICALGRTVDSSVRGGVRFAAGGGGGVGVPA